MFGNVISRHCILNLSPDPFHRKYRRFRKYPNHVTEVCKFRNKTVFRQELESLLFSFFQRIIQNIGLMFNVCEQLFQVNHYKHRIKITSFSTEHKSKEYTHMPHLVMLMLFSIAQILLLKFNYFTFSIFCFFPKICFYNLVNDVDW